MDITDKPQHLAHSANGVQYFIAATDDDNGQKRSVPMSEVEIQQFLNLETPQWRYNINPGDIATIIEGPLADMKVTVTERNG